MRTYRWPWLIPGASSTAILAGAVLTVAVPVPDVTYLVLDAVVGLTFPLVGALIVTRRPRNLLGWLFCLSGAGLAMQALAGGYAVYGEAHGWPGAGFAAWVMNWVFFTGFGPLFLLPMLLPDGRLPSRRWRWVIGTLVLMTVVLQAMLMFRDRSWVWGTEEPNPLGFVPTDVVAVSFGAVIVAMSVAGVVAVAMRVRSAQDRRRLLPVLASAVAIALASIVDAAPPDGLPLLGAWLQAATLPLLPAAAAVAIFRYRLFDIEVLIRRTVVYVAVTCLLLGAYLATVTTFDTLLRQDGGVLEPLLGTAVVAVAFAPLRDAVQRAVARLLFGNRGDPAAALSLLGQRLEVSADPTRLLDGAAETVAHTLRLPSVAVLAADGTPVSVVGGVPEHGVRLPLLSGGQREGELRAAPRSPGEDLSRLDLAVLDDLARHLAVALAAVRLAREVQSSRERLVIAREEERRRLRRDLHDGLGPGLATICVRLDLIRAMAPAGLRDQLREVRQLTDGLVGDIRRTVHDLRPPALDELGLDGALEDLVLDIAPDPGGGPAVAVRAPLPFPALPAAVEVAAYRISQEALANALRHADASNVEITVRAEPERLFLEIRDDGRGLPDPVVEGVGSGSMRERAAELGGLLRRTSSQGKGTIVEAVLPL
ncbi:sensor histidine kinase [Streptosporangium roseum]|uniref:sensor histidine kinase n=1 Tax=Streptosporangium roseum TaxID=2001 RepID=UPI0001A3F240|nr:sensor histidine kinase [Streptosporangium roseum]